MQIATNYGEHLQNTVIRLDSASEIEIINF
jgi:hypothetical protein